MKIKKRYISLIAIVLIGGTLFVQPKLNENKPIKLQVNTVSVESEEISSYLSTSGLIESKVKKEYFGEQGVVNDISVKIGDSVKKGDILFIIKTGGTSKKVKADENGTVTNINLSEGQMNSLSQPVIVTHNLNDLQLVIDLSKYDAPDVKSKQLAKIYYEGKEYDAKVNFVNPIATTQSSSMSQQVEAYRRAYIDIENEKDLIIGFKADIDILTAQKKGVLTIPSEAIETESGQHYVYILRGSDAIKQPIELGVRSDTKSEVLSGLYKGDLVIKNVPTEITEGKNVIVSKK